MKKFELNVMPLALLAMLISTASFASKFPSCNFRTTTNYERGGNSEFGGWSRTTQNIPVGDCEALGRLDSSSSILTCREIAEQKGYDCYQIEDVEVDMLRADRGGNNFRMRVCFACIR
jgi:hypothetical protein